MNFKKIFPTIILGFSLYQTAIAGNKLSCSYATGVGGRGCFFSSMPMYDQLSDVSDGDMYCGPTAAAMGLAAITFGGKSYYVDSWTDRNFAGKSTEERIEAFADLMDTDVEEGTGPIGALKYKSRQRDIASATGNVDLALTTKLNDARMRKLVRRGEVDILNYGHWTENCTGTGSTKVCKYKRDGGHFVAVNGYYYTPGSSVYTTHIFDPGGGVQYEANIKKLPNRTKKRFMLIRLDYRPFFGNTYNLKSSGDYNGIIETVSGINTN